MQRRPCWIRRTSCTGTRRREGVSGGCGIQQSCIVSFSISRPGCLEAVSPFERPDHLSPQDGRERGEKLHRCTVRDRQERSCTEKAMSVSSVESSPPRSACVPVRHGSVVLLRSIPRRVVC